MSVALYVGDRVEDGSITGRRISAQHFVVTFFILEVALLFLCAVAASFCLEAFGVSTFTQEQFEAQAAGAVIGVAVYVIAAYLFPVYSAAHIFDARLNIRRLVLVCLATFGTLVAIAAAMKTTQSYSRVWFFTWWASATDLILFARLCGLVWVRWRLLHGACVFRAISLGLGARPLTPEQLLVHTGYKTRVIKSTALANLADLDAIVDLTRKEKADQIYISAPWNRLPDLASKIDKLRALAIDVFLHCDDEQIRGQVLNVSHLQDGLAFQAGFCPIAGWDGWLKRCEDMLFSLLIIAVTWPILVITAVAIGLESPGPIFFRQIREGLNGTHFELLKFRSMYTEKSDPHAVRQTSKGDPRVTRVGRLIRRLSIDELPQLFNVLGGSMSLVGPRPHALRTRAEGKALDEVVDYYASRHRVKSGITGWAQVNGFRGELDSMEKVRARVEYDLYYIQNWSIWLDIKIIMRTAAQMLFDARAY